MVLRLSKLTQASVHIPQSIEGHLSLRNLLQGDFWVSAVAGTSLGINRTTVALLWCLKPMVPQTWAFGISQPFSLPILMCHGLVFVHLSILGLVLWMLTTWSSDSE